MAIARRNLSRFHPYQTAVAKLLCLLGSCYPQLCRLSKFSFARYLTALVRWQAMLQSEGVAKGRWDEKSICTI